MTEEELRTLLQSPEVVDTPAREKRKDEKPSRARYIRTVILPYNIGRLSDNSGGAATRTMTVMTDGFGNLITATPGIVK